MSINDVATIILFLVWSVTYLHVIIDLGDAFVPLPHESFVSYTER